MDILKEEQAKGNYCIAGGDFNQQFDVADNAKYPIHNKDYFVPGMLESENLPQGFTFAVDDSFSTTRLNNKPYDANDPEMQYYIIDGFIVSDNLDIVNVKVQNENYKYSDHSPVKLEVTLK